jgi:hypothetical protein
MHGTEQLATAGNPKLKTPDIDDMIDEDGKLVVSWKLRWVPLGDLFVDYHEEALNGDAHGSLLSYQRKQRQTGRVMASMGRKNYNPDLFGVLIGVRRHDGKIALCDGGTRFRFLEGLHIPTDTLVPVLVNEWDSKREISNYIDLNRERGSLSQVDWFVAKAKFGDKTAEAIERILIEESGQGVGHQKGGWQAVNMLHYAYRRNTLRRTVRVLRQLGWLDQPSGKSQGIIGGMSRLLFKGAQIERILQTCAGKKPKTVIEEAREYLRAGQSRAVAVAVAVHLGSLYNNKLRKNRLDLTDLLSRTEDESDDDEGASE